MKKSIVLIFMLVSLAMFAQEKSPVTVKDATTTNGIVIVTVQEAGKLLDLQCTQSFPNCAAPTAGEYVMVRLPKNHGLYECANVDLYPKAKDSGEAQMVGEYCLNTR